MNVIREIRELREEGVLHASLIRRTQILAAISAGLLASSLFSAISHGASFLYVVGTWVVSFGFGYYVFSRMNIVEWNEESQVVQAGRMDTVGFVVLGLYIAFEIGSHALLRLAFPAASTAFILAAVAGALSGRLIGSLVEIHRVYCARHGQ